MKLPFALVLIGYLLRGFDFSSCYQHTNNQTSNKTPLYITGLQPLTNSWIDQYGKLTKFAGLMAIRDINQRSDILNDYELRLDVRNTQVS